MEFILNNIWYILIIGAVVLIGGGALLIYTGRLHWLMDILRPNNPRYIKAKVFCEDKQIRDRKLKIGKYVISDDKNRRSYHLIHDLLLTKANTHKQFLALNERDDIPIDFHEKMTPDKREQYPSAQRVFIDTTADIQSNAAKEAASNIMGMSLSIIALGGALAIIVMAIVMFWQNRGM